MANKKFWFGMLIMVLVFGMAAVGCDTGTGGGGGGGGSPAVPNALETLGLSKAPPSLATKNAHGLDETAFNAIINAGGIGHYRGWAYLYDEFIMVWTARNLRNFEDIIDAVINAGFTRTWEEIEAGVHLWRGENAGGVRALIDFFSIMVYLDYQDYFIPAGTIFLGFIEP